MKAPKNENYAATVVTLSNIIKLENCDNVVGTMVFGCHVVTNKDTKVGDRVIYFPSETQLSAEYLRENNLYRDATLNKNPEKKGYFETNGRIRCQKFRGHMSDGLVMPLTSLEFASNEKLKDGATFDELNDIRICKKYVIEQKDKVASQKIGQPRKKRSSRLVDGQFRLHEDTSHLARNLFKIKNDDIVAITNKLHGCNASFGKVLVKRDLKWYEKVLKRLGVQIQDTEYDLVYASRSVVKNAYAEPVGLGFYKCDVWGEVAAKIKDLIPNGYSLYGEIVGYLPTKAMIQKHYDYGCKEGEFDFYVFRVTVTNVDGNVLELNHKQIQEFCKLRGLKFAPEFYYGSARNLVGDFSDPRDFQEAFFAYCKTNFNLEKDCDMCRNSVPAEGCIVRIDNKPTLEAFKLKAERFKLFETKELDKGEVNIEDVEEESV